MNPLAVFKTAALNHSATLPSNGIKHLDVLVIEQTEKLAPNWHP